MLPKTFYEALPYLYLAVGSYLLLSMQTALLWGCGLLLYFAGALIWIRRANHRRPIQATQPPPTGAGPGRLGQATSQAAAHPIPPRIYELLPFVYILTGYLCYGYYRLMVHSYPALVAIALFITAGACAWGMRGYHRGYHRTRAATH
ncbi:hypothetical protein [Motiliproteus sp. SC1-56]|uniref:hypothetical protein n=1 Tax=Motiliproteus sp. SC1-56 TaxID=2799565 RepID=UPI001A8D655F|nr:hypothetical protein [Motiliproteus sp. SC1-56]